MVSEAGYLLVSRPDLQMKFSRRIAVIIGISDMFKCWMEIKQFSQKCTRALCNNVPTKMWTSKTEDKKTFTNGPYSTSNKHLCGVLNYVFAILPILP